MTDVMNREAFVKEIGVALKLLAEDLERNSRGTKNEAIDAARAWMLRGVADAIGATLLGSAWPIRLHGGAPNTHHKDWHRGYETVLFLFLPDEAMNNPLKRARDLFVALENISKAWAENPNKMGRALMAAILQGSALISKK